MQIEPCPHCGDKDCDTDCGERALIYREHRRQQLADIEIDPAELCPDCGAYIGDEWPCDVCEQEASDATTEVAVKDDAAFTAKQEASDAD